jgi:AcrR family transcriptional regulator
MPPKVRVTREDIINIAVELVRSNGADALNARAIAAALNCSTQPIFSNFATMDDLRDATIHSAYELYLSFLKKEQERGRYPAYKSFGMAYICFARDERELFKLLFMRDRTGEDISSPVDFEMSVEMIMKANGVTAERARLMHLEVWACAHGIATMLATSFLTLESDLISDMLSDIYQGVRLRHLSEDHQNDCN